MNIQEYLQHEMCTVTESMLPDRIRLSETLNKYQIGDFNVEHHDLFESCVQKILSGEYDRYNFRQEQVKRLFRFTSQAKNELYQNLIFFEAGKRLSADTDNLTLKQLDEFGDKMDYGFYLSFTIDEVKLHKLISNLKYNSILRDAHSYADYGDNIYDFCRKEIKTGKTNEEIISLITPYNDGSYVELPEYISLLSFILLRDKQYNHWVSLLTRVKYFPLQGALLYHIHTLQEFFSIFQELKRPNVIHRKVILHLLRDRYFQIISKQPKTLKRGLEYLTLNRKSCYREICEKLLEAFINDNETNTKIVFGYLSNQLGLSNCSEWYSKKYNQYADGDKRFVEDEQNAIEVIGRIMSGLSNPVRWDVLTADINTLLYYIRQTEIKQITKYRSKLLMQALFKCLYSNQNYYQLRLNEESFKLLRLVYACLVKSELDPLQMLQLFSYANEGYIVDYTQIFQTRRGDTFWFSMLLLGTGEEEDDELFNRYVEVLLQRVISQSGDAKEYTLPLYIAELVFTQVLNTRKAEFEEYIINNISNLSIVLTTLLANQGDLIQPVKSLLLERIYKEWDIEESLMKIRKDSNLRILNDYIQMIKVN